MADKRETKRPIRGRVAPWLVLAGTLAAALGVYFGFLGSAWVEAVSTWTASSTSAALNLVGASTFRQGTVIASDRFAVNIVAECTAVGPLLVFAGAVAAYPAGIRQKGAGILMGLTALTAMNLLRIMSLFWIGSAFPQYLSVAHLLVWQTVMILSAIVLWLLWMERVAGARHR